jgi:hypothetical protein
MIELLVRVYVILFSLASFSSLLIFLQLGSFENADITSLWCASSNSADFAVDQRSLSLCDFSSFALFFVNLLSLSCSLRHSV